MAGQGKAYYRTGQRDAAERMLSKAVRYHPESPGGARHSRFEMEAFSGSPQAALAILHDPEQRPLSFSPGFTAALEAFLHARQTRSEADTSRALAALRRESGPYLVYMVFAATVLGRVDDAFATLNDPAFTILNDPENAYCCYIELLFDPVTAPLRRDPRFWTAAARLGLVKYWRERGVWPDFCSDPTVGVDCKAAAAQVTGVH